MKAATKIILIYIIQLFLTECLSICLFGWRRLAFEAPIVLLFMSIETLQEGIYILFIKSLILNVLFFSIMIFSIVKNHGILGSLCLFLYNAICIMLILASLL